MKDKLVDELPCGCCVSLRKGRVLRWLLRHKWYKMFDWVHGEPSNVKLLVGSPWLVLYKDGVRPIFKEDL